ncbi:MAG: hypothetical protein D6794_10320 [Deltaproteobacteria bacterium]|nr:MAG: hypothetical protein D6794_10320 [Deltaproteobacteria bacterium]
MFLAATLALVFLAGCTGGGGQRACPAGTPMPIGSDTMAAVVAHHFERHGQESVEEFALVDGWRVELYQSGCDLIRQEFRFGAPDTVAARPAEELFAVAAERFRKMAGLSPAWAPFSQWADAIESVATEARPGVPVELPGHIRLRVEDYHLGPEWWIVVVLEQRIE